MNGSRIERKALATLSIGIVVFAVLGVGKAVLALVTWIGAW